MTKNQNDGDDDGTASERHGNRRHANDVAFLSAVSSAISAVYVATHSVPAVVTTAFVAAIVAMRARTGR